MFRFYGEKWVQIIQDQGDFGAHECKDASRLFVSAQYLRRGKTTLWVTVSLLVLSLVVLAVGLISATRTDNVPVAGYYAGITVSDDHPRLSLTC